MDRMIAISNNNGCGGLLQQTPNGVTDFINSARWIWAIEADSESQGLEMSARRTVWCGL